MLKQCMHLFCTYFDCILFNWHFQKQEDAKQIKEFPPSSNLYFSMRDRLEIKNVYVRCAKCHSEKIIRERRSGTKRGKAKYNLIRGVIRESLYAALHLSKYGIVHFTILHGVFIFYLLTTHHSFSVTASLRVLLVPTLSKNNHTRHDDDELCLSWLETIFLGQCFSLSLILVRFWKY